MINIELIQNTAEHLMRKAAIEIPEDYHEGLKKAAADEENELPSFVLKVMLENYEVAKEDRCAMCGDTGVPRWFVKLGNEARLEGGMVALETALRKATATATNDVPLRPNRVHPLWRMAFGKRGLACQPAIIGIGLGGSKDTCMSLGKRASTLRIVGSRNSDSRIAKMEDEFKALGNSIGMGAMGFVGKNMVVDCNIEVGYCHTGGMPMSVHAFCLSSRRAVARIFPDGRVEHRTDPDWFTPYQRRESIDWEPGLENEMESEFGSELESQLENRNESS